MDHRGRTFAKADGAKPVRNIANGSK